MAFKLPPPPLGQELDSFVWKDWLNRLQQFLGNVGNILFTDLNFTGSNLTSIATRNHNDLQNIQGGSVTERYHLTAAQAISLSSGGLLGPPGYDGEDGQDGVSIPGPQGSIGLTGPQGIQGVSGFHGWDGIDGEDSYIPGPTGAQGSNGSTGLTGSQGPQGPVGIGLDGEEGTDNFIYLSQVTQVGGTGLSNPQVLTRVSFRF